MRVAVLATTRHPIVQPYGGGQESHTATLVRHLRRRGVHVRLYADRDTDPRLADELVPYDDVATSASDVGLRLDAPEPDFQSSQAALFGALSHLAAHPDVDVVHNQTLNYLPLAADRLVPCPMVTTLHTPPFAWLELGATLAGPSHRFVAVSRALAHQWTHRGIAPSVIHNGIDLADFPLGDGGEDLVWCGRLVPEKGVDLAIDAARETGRRLRLAGPVANPDYFSSAVAPELGPDVEYVGHLEHPQVMKLVGDSAALLMTPRWDEPFGLVVPEAAATGTPVAAIARGGLREIVTPPLGTLVEPDPDPGRLVRSLAAAVERAVLLPRAAVRAEVAGRFDATVMAEHYEHLFEHVLDGARARA